MEAKNSFDLWPRRSFEQITPISAREVCTVDGTKLIQVSSTQYLGTLWNCTVRSQLRHLLDNAKIEACGSFGSNFLGGTHPARVRFERALATEVSSEQALAFASGWAANYAIGEMCSKCCDVVISDIRSHNSVIHGLKSAKTHVLVADLCEPEWVRDLQGLSYQRIAILTPSVEGIAGTNVLPFIPDDIRVHAIWVQDESHTFGAVGDRGSEPFCNARPDLRVLGLSKAYGTVGAVVCGTGNLIEYLAQVGSPWMFSTALPPLSWEINLELLPYVLGMKQERRKILDLATRFRSRLRDSGTNHSGAHHITGVHVEAGTEAAWDVRLRESGFLARVSMFPTRPREDPCIRIAFSPEHHTDDVDRLASLFSV